MRRCLPSLFFLGLTLACDARIQHGLDERQANEIESVLLERGIHAKKAQEAGKKPTWAIEVSDDRADDAVRVLAELGLPRPKNEGFQDVFGKGSLVPSPTEERALYLEALSGEMARTLESVDGVVSARVHVVLPAASRPGEPGAPAKASALLRVRTMSVDRVNLMRAELRALMAAGVEGLAPDNVTIVVNEIAPHPALHPPPPLGRFRFFLLAGGALGSVLVAVAAAALLKARSTLPPPRPTTRSMSASTASSKRAA